MVLTRESIRNGLVEEIAAEARRQGLFEPLSPERRRASLQEILDAAGPGRDVWVFGYGSLMWNPAFHHEERLEGCVHGYHRQFCLWTPVGRGTPDNPGLMLGLERGGSCHGVALRVAAQRREEELDVLWRREMVAGSYTPRWVTVRPGGSDRGRQPVRAVTFVINREHHRYAGRVDPTVAAQHIATAVGRLGPCREYLESTVAHLTELGIRDRTLSDLLARVHRVAGNAGSARSDGER